MTEIKGLNVNNSTARLVEGRKQSCSIGIIRCLRALIVGNGRRPVGISQKSIINNLIKK